MIITISGKLGSGKSTVARMLSDELGYRCISAGAMMRDLAQKRGLTIVEFNQLCAKDKSIDLEMDEYIVQLGKTEENIIVDSRLAFFFIPHSFKIKLSISDKKAAERIFCDTTRTTEKKYASLKELENDIVERRKLEVNRFNELYGVNIEDEKLFDCVIDTGDLTPHEIVELIKKSLCI